MYHFINMYVATHNTIISLPDIFVFRYVMFSYKLHIFFDNVFSRKMLVEFFFANILETHFAK
jgi:hypothetical protein